jgi:hypothetical protein
VLREAGANLPVVVWNVGHEMERSGEDELPVLWCEGPAEGACMAVALAELDPPVGFSVRVLGASSGLRLALRWLAGRRGIDTTMTVGRWVMRTAMSVVYTD